MVSYFVADPDIWMFIQVSDEPQEVGDIVAMPEWFSSLRIFHDIQNIFVNHLGPQCVRKTFSSIRDSKDSFSVLEIFDFIPYTLQEVEPRLFAPEIGMFAQTFQASFIMRDQATYKVQSLPVIWGISSQILGTDLLKGFPTPC